jgi:hypothetical protein
MEYIGVELGESLRLSTLFVEEVACFPLNTIT